MQITITPPDAPLIDSPTPASKLTIIALAVLQSVLLLVAHESLDREWWLAQNNAALVSWYTLVLILPATLYLILRDATRLAPWLLTLALGLILLPQAWYTGMACVPAEAINCGQILPPFALTQFIAWFIVVHFMQTSLDAGRVNFDYPALFEYGWHNALTIVLTAVFLGIFWCLLTLWAALFDLIGIDFFGELFTDRRFSYPISGLMVGFGIVICRTRFNAVTTLREIVLAIFHALLPLLATIGLLFLISLVFTGVAPLWDTWSAASLLGWVIVLTVLFFNAVFQDGEGPQRYPAPVRLLVETALVALPVFAALALWALTLRVAQHGWSVDRLSGLVVLAALAAYAVSYCAAVLLRLLGWVRVLQDANIAIALTLVGVFWLSASPLLDFRKITVADQLQRLNSGATEAEDFDYDYFRFGLGNPGVEALRELRTNPLLASQTIVKQRIESLLTSENRWDIQHPQLPDDALIQAFTVAPDSAKPDLALLRAVLNTHIGNDCAKPEKPCVLIEAPLGRDAETLWILVNKERSYQQPSLFTACDKGWCAAGNLSKALETRQIERLIAGDYETAEPRFRELLIGDQRSVVIPDD